MRAVQGRASKGRKECRDDVHARGEHVGEGGGRGFEAAVAQGGSGATSAHYGGGGELGVEHWKKTAIRLQQKCTGILPSRYAP